MVVLLYYHQRLFKWGDACKWSNEWHTVHMYVVKCQNAVYSNNCTDIANDYSQDQYWYQLLLDFYHEDYTVQFDIDSGIY